MNTIKSNSISKPFSMIVKETKNKLIKVCNESELSPVVLDLILQGMYSEIHFIVERQTVEEESSYYKMLEEESKKEKVADENAN